MPPILPNQPLPNHRKGRYRGDDLCLSLAEFTPEDQTAIVATYRFLQELFVVLKNHHSHPDDGTLAAARAFITAQNMTARAQIARAMGATSLHDRSSDLLAKTVHDLRGGALSALMGNLYLAKLEPPDAAGLRQLFFLTRDHLKIMRNALLGLDDPAREADLTPKLHSVDLISEKWQHALVTSQDQRRTRLEVTSDFHGNIAESCVEFGALDRVLYNLVNNACRHTASGEVKLAIRSQPEASTHPEDLCFCVSNPVDDADQRHLAARGDLNELFQSGVSTTGSGLGMTVALDFVQNAYGLQSTGQAFDGGYLGARLVEREFQVWFHWPIADGV